MVSNDFLTLLNATPPFQELDPPDLERLATRATVESYPRGALISADAKNRAPAIHLIKSGAVKVTIPFGRSDEALVDFRGEGEMFGYLALLTGDTLRGEIFCLDDTTCYRIDRAAVLDLLQRSPAFAREFFLTFLHKYVAKPHRELGKKRLFYGGGDRLLFTTPVGALVGRGLISAPEHITIREAAATMAKEGIGSLVLRNTLGLPSGIITNNDLRDKVLAKGRDPEQPASRIQSLSLVKAESAELCIEALFKMIRYDIHHLLVLDGGRPKGIVTTNDLIKLQGTSPISIVREIEESQSPAELARPAAKLHDLLGHFLQEGVKASQILRIVGEIGDKLLGQLLLITQKKLGPPPLPFAFLLLGSGARREQTFPGLYNCALIHADASTPQEENQAGDYCRTFAKQAQESLDALHLPHALFRSRSDFTIRCHSLAAWRQCFAAWISQADPPAVEAFSRYYDFRGLHGDSHLVIELRESVRRLLQAHPPFYHAAARVLADLPPPLTAQHHLVVEEQGPHQGCFPYAARALKPLAAAARLLAMHHQLDDTNSLTRLLHSAEIAPFLRDYGDDLEYAYEVIYGFWLLHQHDQLCQGFPGHSFLNPKRLCHLEISVLQQALTETMKVQSLVAAEMSKR